MGKLGRHEVKWLAWGQIINKWQNQHEDLQSPRFNTSLLSALLQKRKNNTPALKSSGHLTRLLQLCFICAGTNKHDS